METINVSRMPLVLWNSGTGELSLLYYFLEQPENWEVHKDIFQLPEVTPNLRGFCLICKLELEVLQYLGRGGSLSLKNQGNREQWVYTYLVLLC